MALLQEIKVPLLSVNDTSLTIIETTLKTGDAVSVGQVILVFETSKTSYEVIAESSGYIQYLSAVGEDYAVNETVALIFSDPKETDASIVVSIKKSPKTQFRNTTDRNGETQFSAAARKLIDENNLSINIDLIHKEFLGNNDLKYIMFKNKPIIKSYKGHINEKQKNSKIQHYSILWNNRNVYI
jgi:pyruvate/2-oxoglutarate dehydrogenase complex dihydrolipoamide acyltransferase (E2) component